MSKVILQCIPEGRKLRVRFHQFIDKDGKTFTNVYNNNYNCRFPKNIRKEGCFYEIPDTDITLNTGRGKPYYIVKKNNIKILSDVQENREVDINITVYEVNECVICLDSKPEKVFYPCGHQCCCNACIIGLRNSTNKCPLCRRNIDSI
jgi:hypothetical protein